MEFKDRIRDLRSKSGLSGEEFGKLFGVSRNTVSVWERGRNHPNNDVLLRIADYFNVSLDYLMGRTDVKNIAIESDQIPQGYNQLTRQQKNAIETLIALLITANKEG